MIAALLLLSLVPDGVADAKKYGGRVKIRHKNSRRHPHIHDHMEYYHIPKTGGSMINGWLHKARHCPIRKSCGHLCDMMSFRNNTNKSESFVILREPCDRFVSSYWQMRVWLYRQYQGARLKETPGNIFSIDFPTPNAFADYLYNLYKHKPGGFSVELDLPDVSTADFVLGSPGKEYEYALWKALKIRDDQIWSTCSNNHTIYGDCIQTVLMFPQSMWATNDTQAICYTKDGLNKNFTDFSQGRFQCQAGINKRPANASHRNVRQLNNRSKEKEERDFKLSPKQCEKVRKLYAKDVALYNLKCPGIDPKCKEIKIISEDEELTPCSRVVKKKK